MLILVSQIDIERDLSSRKSFKKSSFEVECIATVWEQSAKYVLSTRQQKYNRYINMAEGKFCESLPAEEELLTGEELLWLCGTFETCFNNICVCHESWSRSIEWDFYHQLEQKKGLYCDTNQSLIRGLYIVSIVSILVRFAWFIKLLTQKDNKEGSGPSGIRRSILALTGLTFLLLHSLWRTWNIESTLFGENFSSSFLLVIGIGCLVLSSWSYINFHLSFEYKRAWLTSETNASATQSCQETGGSGIGVNNLVSSSKHHQRSTSSMTVAQVRILQRLQIVLFLSIISACLLSLSLPFIAAEYAGKVIQVVFVLMSGILTHISVVYILLFKSLVAHLQYIVSNTAGSASTQNTVTPMSLSRRQTMSNTRSIEMSALKEKVMVRMQKTLPSFKLIPIMGFINILLILAIIVPSMFSETWLRAWKYFVPLFITSFSAELGVSEWYYKLMHKVEGNEKLIHRLMGNEPSL